MYRTVPLHCTFSMVWGIGEGCCGGGGGRGEGRGGGGKGGRQKGIITVMDYLYSL